MMSQISNLLVILSFVTLVFVVDGDYNFEKNNNFSWINISNFEQKQFNFNIAKCIHRVSTTDLPELEAVAFPPNHYLHYDTIQGSKKLYLKENLLKQQLFNDRKIIFIGDSVMFQQYVSFGCMLDQNITFHTYEDYYETFLDPNIILRHYRLGKSWQGKNHISHHSKVI